MSRRAVNRRHRRVASTAKTAGFDTANRVRRRENDQLGLGSLLRIARLRELRLTVRRISGAHQGRRTVTSGLHTTPANWGGAAAVESISVRSYTGFYSTVKKKEKRKGGEGDVAIKNEISARDGRQVKPLSPSDKMPNCSCN